jgi:alpha-N-acetylglucosamine transferase
MLFKTNKHTKNKTQKLKYCCPDSKITSQCTKINTKNNFTLNNIRKYAIMTLLFGGDSYLPSILLLGSSIRKIMPKSYEQYVTLCCMITNDVSMEARDLIYKIYDKVIEVDYLEISPTLIKHKKPHIRQIYAKTFTKLRIFEMIEYDKVLYLDPDMLVINKNIFSLFNLNTPAVVFIGKLTKNLNDRYFKEFKENGKLFKQFQNKYCNWNGKNSLHGELIPYDKKYENEKVSNGMNIETSILLIKPSKHTSNEIYKYLQNIKNTRQKISDTELISRFFKDKLYAIEPRFFGRWVNPDEQPELVVLDLYGSDGKPWDIDKFDKLVKYSYVGDISYWWSLYMKMYKTEYAKWNNKMLDNLYYKIKEITK